MTKNKRKKFIKSINEILNTETFKWIYINNKKSTYLISSHGKIYSTNYYSKTNKFIELKARIQNNGYLVYHLYMDGQSYPFLLHRLVAEYFIPNPDNLPAVNHIDGNKKNNNVNNLEWVTFKDNSIHASDTGLIPTGEKSRLSKISNKTAKAICEEFEKNELTFKEIIKKYNTTYNTVYDIYRRKSWKQLSIKYDFSNYNKDSRFLNNKKNK